MDLEARVFEVHRFTTRLTKTAHVIKSLMNEGFNGVVVSDRAKTYDGVPWHQWCWSHL